MDVVANCITSFCVRKLRYKIQTIVAKFVILIIKRDLTSFVSLLSVTPSIHLYFLHGLFAFFYNLTQAHDNF